MSLTIGILAAIGLLLLPGGILGIALGLRGLWLAALAAPFSLASTGLAGILAAWLGLPFAAWQPLALAVAGSAAVLAIRLPLQRRSLWRRFGRIDTSTRWTGAAFVAASALTILVFFMTVGDPRSISQSYDGVFHLNAVAWILDTGDASSFHLYRITHPGDDNEFYPAGWHSLVALVVQLAGPLLGEVPIAVATNAVWLATTVLIWLPGVALLTRVVAGRGRGVPAEGIAVLLAAVATAMPWTLLGWGTLYPTGLATAITPVGLAIAASLLRRRDASRIAPLVIAAGLWAAAGVVAHPRALLSFVVLAAPLVVATYRRGPAPARAPEGRAASGSPRARSPRRSWRLRPPAGGTCIRPTMSPTAPSQIT
jgi:hypothetical protein